MTNSFSLPPVDMTLAKLNALPMEGRANRQLAAIEASDLGQRFEQMLWAEMLSHAGFEEALTRGGGEGAASFSRFVVEAVAKDLAARHPLGIGETLPEGGAAPEAASLPGHGRDGKGEPHG